MSSLRGMEEVLRKYENVGITKDRVIQEAVVASVEKNGKCPILDTRCEVCPSVRKVHQGARSASVCRFFVREERE